MDLAFAASSGLIVGSFVGARWYRWRLHRALRAAAQRHPATVEPIDHEAMFRIIQQHKGD